MKALLLAMMEPTANIEQDFQDWYDHEHVPEREVVPGFINARRYVCLEGFPRYLALYDLDTFDVLKGDDYQKLLQPPPHHTRDKVLGRYRFTGNQIYPGDTLLGEGGAGTRLILLRFRKPPEAEESHILRGLRRNFDDRSGVCQVRLFRGGAKSGTDYVATIECHANICEQRVKPEFFGTALKYMDVENVYAPYWRTTK